MLEDGTIIDHQGNYSVVVVGAWRRDVGLHPVSRPTANVCFGLVIPNSQPPFSASSILPTTTHITTATELNHLFFYNQHLQLFAA